MRDFTETIFLTYTTTIQSSDGRRNNTRYYYDMVTNPNDHTSDYSCRTSCDLGGPNSKYNMVYIESCVQYLPRWVYLKLYRLSIFIFLSKLIEYIISMSAHELIHSLIV